MILCRHCETRAKGASRAQLRLVAASALIIGLFSPAAAARSDPNALWNIVHGQCVPDMQRHGDPSPCRKVDLTGGRRGGYAILKDIRGATQFLLIPTRRVSGIESRSLVAPRAANYFADAWKSRHVVTRALGHAMPDDTLSLAINSPAARSQNQLHIHIDCVRADVRNALRRQRSKIGRRWKRLQETLLGHHYRARRVVGTTLVGHDPFKLLARGVPGARTHMGQHTLVVVGMLLARHVPGFVILDDRADPARNDYAHGEELQDHACTLARGARH
jgi:CDP-diacylglycerol pyrophosphatase